MEQRCHYCNEIFTQAELDRSTAIGIDTITVDDKEQIILFHTTCLIEEYHNG